MMKPEIYGSFYSLKIKTVSSMIIQKNCALRWNEENWLTTKTWLSASLKKLSFLQKFSGKIVLGSNQMKN